jgi:hypothetical protein
VNEGVGAWFIPATTRNGTFMPFRESRAEMPSVPV